MTRKVLIVTLGIPSLLLAIAGAVAWRITGRDLNPYWWDQ